MVHNLRARNVCGTSNQIQGNKRQTVLAETTPVSALERNMRLPEIRTIQMQPQSHCSSGEHAGSTTLCSDAASTPFSFNVTQSQIYTISPLEIFGRKSGNRINLGHFEQPNSLLGANKANILTSTRLVATSPKKKSKRGLAATSPEMKSKMSHTSRSYESFQSNISAAVDEAIFKKTYKSTKGASLHAVRKGVEDFGYKPNSTRAPVCSYVRDNLKKGNLIQVTGNGASGTFRHNKSIHNKFLRAHKENKMHKIRNVTATCLKRFKKHDLELYETIRDNSITQRRIKH